MTSGRIIVDTTAPTLEEDAWLLRHDGEKIEFIDIEKGDGIGKNEYSVIETEIKPYDVYINNLKEVKPA